MNEKLTIGRLSSETDLGIEAIRFYERKGLLPKPPRSSSGHRVFPPDAISRINFIQQARNLGFTLDEIGELLVLRVDPKVSCDDVKERVEMKLRSVEEKLKTLTRIKKTLKDLIAACEEGRPSVGECPIIETMKCQKNK
jgi:MerR family mercuric resistance operon transcriptional regulator